jgi:hypothetical protein
VTPDPDVWYQRRPGGAWYRRPNGQSSYHVKRCEKCGQEFLGQVQNRFCSRSYATSYPGRTVLVGSSNPSWRERPGYAAAHLRVRRARGSASQHPCVDCGTPARDWSYDGRDPDELVAVERGYEVRYSVNPEHYVARCLTCHVRYDVLHGKRSMPGEKHPNAKPDRRTAARRHRKQARTRSATGKGQRCAGVRRVPGCVRRHDPPDQTPSTQEPISLTGTENGG